MASNPLIPMTSESGRKQPSIPQHGPNTSTPPTEVPPPGFAPFFYSCGGAKNLFSGNATFAMTSNMTGGTVTNNHYYHTPGDTMPTETPNSSATTAVTA
ncbi:hypothetical protein BJ165DRAFT_8305 [Panaeolus papilionaceus]|nr:hypothetical protein BJ165DRAFT_8305 [Panaeolus papilionaceus]